MQRRAEVSQDSNERYLEGLAAIDHPIALHQLLDKVSRPLTYGGRRVRALRIGDPQDVALLQAISRGEFAPSGFRNRDLRLLLHPSKRANCPAEARRASGRITRQLRLLRAHGVIKKIPKSHRYHLTPYGHSLTTALFAARQSSVQKLVGCIAA